jgi:DNA-binding MarR family transcriptional regulator
MTSQVLTPQALPQTSAALTAWVRLLRGHSAARRTLDASLQAEHGLTVTAHEALLMLARAEDKLLRRVDLAEGLGLTASGVTRLLDGLEAEGFVAKATCESDARATYAVLTEKGRAKFDEASSSHIAAVRDLFEERYTPAELETLAELLLRLPGAPGADADECTA